MSASTPVANIGNIDKPRYDALEALIRASDSLLAGLLTEAKVEAEAGTTTLWGHKVSDMQADVEVEGDAIYGILYPVTEGQLVTDWGAGYFITLKFSEFATGLTYADVKVGLDPSQGSGLVTLDADQNGVFKVTDKNVQKLKVVSSDGTRSTIQSFDLSNLILEVGD